MIAAVGIGHALLAATAALATEARAVAQAMSVLAALAALVNALELWQWRSSLSATGIWRTATLASAWGVFAPLLATNGFRALLLVQMAAALSLALVAGSNAGAACAMLVAGTTLLSAMRVRGTVNGGSDAMLFTVLVALAVTQLEFASAAVREGALLYVAAQTTLSYLRAGIVKARQRAWFSGEALRAFLALPAYGVPRWIPRGDAALRGAGVSVVLFELLAPVAWFSPALCLAFIVVALGFHLGAALVFGLNRFLLAWAAALPSLWFAVHRVSA